MPVPTKAPWVLAREKTLEGFSLLIKRYPDETSAYLSDEEIQIGNHIQALEALIAELERQLEVKSDCNVRMTG